MSFVSYFLLEGGSNGQNKKPLIYVGGFIRSLLYVVKYVKIYQERHKKLEKNEGQIDSFLPWTQI